MSKENEPAWIGEHFKTLWGTPDWEKVVGSGCWISNTSAIFYGIIYDPEQDCYEAVIRSINSPYLNRVHVRSITKRSTAVGEIERARILRLSRDSSYAAYMDAHSKILQLKSDVAEKDWTETDRELLASEGLI